MTEGAEVTEVHMELKLHTAWFMVEDKVAGERKLDDNWQNWYKADIWMGTGEAYNKGFLKIKAVDLYWRGE